MHVTSTLVTTTVGHHGLYTQRTVVKHITGLPAAAARRIAATLNAITLAASTASGDEVPGDTQLVDTVTLARTDPSLVTFDQDFYAFFYGAAHGTGESDPLTFDRATGRRLRVSDWIAKGKRTAFLSVLSKESRRQLKARGIDSFFWLDGTKPVLGNFLRYKPVPRGWEIHFSDYQVASHAEGLVTIVVPWTRLRGLVGRKLPTRYCAGDAGRL